MLVRELFENEVSKESVVKPILDLIKHNSYSHAARSLFRALKEHPDWQELVSIDKSLKVILIDALKRATTEPETSDLTTVNNLLAAADKLGVDEEIILDFQDAVDEIEGLADEAFRKLAKAYNCSASLVRDLWSGGPTDEGANKFADKAFADGYDELGGWPENKDWFKRHGVTEKEFDAISFVSV